MTIVQDHIDRLESLKAGREVWETHWDEVSRYVLPRKKNFIQRDVIEGHKKWDDVYDATAVLSNEIFAASLHGMLVSPVSQWFKMETEIDELNQQQDVIEWLDDTSERMLASIMDPDAQFTSQLDELFLDIGAFGTGLMAALDGPGAKGKPGPVIIFDAWNVSQTYVSENAEGAVDTFYRVFKWTARQIKLFMESNDPGSFSVAPRELHEALEKNKEQKYEVLHALTPREGVPLASKSQKAVESAWVATSFKFLIHSSGFDEQPAYAARWRKTSWETYGRGPGIQALADIKMLNELKKGIIEATEKMLNPPLDVPHKAYIGKIKTGAAQLNYRKPNRMNERIEPLVTVGNIPVTYELLDRVAQSVRSAFYNDQLQLAQGPDMTAYEVAQRQNEKLRLMSPMLGRIQSELFSPILGRVLKVMNRAGKLKPVPASLKANNPLFRPRYLSQLAQAQQATDADAVVRTLGIVSQMAQFDPRVLDPFNLPEAAKIVARVSGYPSEAMRTDKEVKQIEKRQAENSLQEEKKTDVERVAEIVKNTGDLKQAAG